MDVFLRYMKFNDEAEEICRETAAELVDTYQEVGQDWPQPARPPQLD